MAISMSSSRSKDCVYHSENMIAAIEHITCLRLG